MPTFHVVGRASDTSSALSMGGIATTQGQPIAIDAMLTANKRSNIHYRSVRIMLEQLRDTFTVVVAPNSLGQQIGDVEYHQLS